MKFYAVSHSCTAASVSLFMLPAALFLHCCLMSVTACGSGSKPSCMQVHPGVIRTKLGRHSKGFKFMTTFMPWAMSVKSVEAGECSQLN